MSLKNPEKSLQRSQSHLFTSTAKETNCMLLRPSMKTKRMLFFSFELGDRNPVAIQRTVWWFLYNTSVSEQEKLSVKWSVTVFLCSSFYRCKHRIHPSAGAHSNYFIVMWKLSRMKESVKLLSTAMRTIDFEAIFIFIINYVQFWISFHSFKLRLSLDTDLIHFW